MVPSLQRQQTGRKNPALRQAFAHKRVASGLIAYATTVVASISSVPSRENMSQTARNSKWSLTEILRVAWQQSPTLADE